MQEITHRVFSHAPSSIITNQFDFIGSKEARNGLEDFFLLAIFTWKVNGPPQDTVIDIRRLFRNRFLDLPSESQKLPSGEEHQPFPDATACIGGPENGQWTV